MTLGPALDRTHAPDRHSWVPARSPDSSAFPLQNLPFGRFIRKGQGRPCIGVAIGDSVLDLATLDAQGLFRNLPDAVRQACTDEWLNRLMSLSSADRSRLRELLHGLLVEGSANNDITSRCLVPRREAQLLVPADVRNFTDFYTSIHHARTSGSLVRPGSPLVPNFHHLPMAYHGRASTVSASGTSFPRPFGLAALGEAVTFSPTCKLDYECEVAVWVGGPGTTLGQRVPLSEAPEHVFGLGLLNDWSARDIQRFEAQPLGPFLAKSFLTSVSPWVVTLEALAPFRVAAAERAPDAPALSPHLHDTGDRRFGGVDIALEVHLSSAAMRRAGIPPLCIARPNFRDQYWTIFQMFTHHVSNGCSMLPGDLIGSGTVSGDAPDQRGCLLEMLRDGQEVLQLPSGERRTYLEDGDEVTLSAFCHAPGRVSIGFGACVGRVLPAVDIQHRETGH